MRRHFAHTLVGGGGQHRGFDALDFRKIKHGDAGKLGNLGCTAILFALPDKFARFLYDFHDFLFESLDHPRRFAPTRRPKRR